MKVDFEMPETAITPNVELYVFVVTFEGLNV